MPRPCARLGDTTTIRLAPTHAAPVPPRGERLSARRALRAHHSMLTCSAGTPSGLQISLPLADVAGLPVGLSRLGARGADELRLAATRDEATTLGATSRA